VKKMEDMGFQEHNARVALSSSNWELERATEQLFASWSSPALSNLVVRSQPTNANIDDKKQRFGMATF